MPPPSPQPSLPTIHARWTQALSLDPGPRTQALRKLLESLSSSFEWTHPTRRVLPPSKLSHMYFDFGLSRAFLGEYGLACYTFDEAVKRDETFALGWFAYGLAAAELGRWKEARSYFKKCSRAIKHNGEGLDILLYPIFQGRENVLLGLGEVWVLEQTRVDFNFNRTFLEKGSRTLGINPVGAGQSRQIRNGLNGIPAGLFLGPDWDADALILEMDAPTPQGETLRMLVSPAAPEKARHSRSMPVMASIQEVPVASWFAGDDSPESNKFKVLRSASVDQGYGVQAQLSNALRLSSNDGCHTIRPSRLIEDDEDDEDATGFTMAASSWNKGDDSPETAIHDAARLSWTEQEGTPDPATRDIARRSMARAKGEHNSYLVKNNHSEPLKPQRDMRLASTPHNTDQHHNTERDSRMSIVSQDFAILNAPCIPLSAVPYSPYPVRSALPSPLKPGINRVSFERADSNEDETPRQCPYAVRKSITPSKTADQDDFLIPFMAPRKGANVPRGWLDLFSTLPRYSRAIHYGDFADFNAGSALQKLQQSEGTSLTKRVRDSFIDDGQKADEKFGRVKTHSVIGEMERMELIDNIIDDDETLVDDDDFERALLQPKMYEGWPNGWRKGSKYVSIRSKVFHNVWLAEFSL